MVAATKQQEQPVSPPLPKQQSPKKQGCVTKSTKLKKNQQSKATVRRARCLLQGCFAHRASLRVDRGALVGQLEHLHHVRELIMIIMLKRLSCDQTVKYGLIVQSLPDPLPGVVSNLNLVSLMCQKLPCGPRRAASRSATGALSNGNMARETRTHTQMRLTGVGTNRRFERGKLRQHAAYYLLLRTWLRTATPHTYPAGTATSTS